MPKKRSYMVKVWVEEPEYELIEQMSKKMKLTKSEVIRRIIIAFKILTTTPLYMLLRDMPSDLYQEHE